MVAGQTAIEELASALQRCMNEAAQKAADRAVQQVADHAVEKAADRAVEKIRPCLDRQDATLRLIWKQMKGSGPLPIDA